MHTVHFTMFTIDKHVIISLGSLEKQKLIVRILQNIIKLNICLFKVPSKEHFVNGLQ